MILHYFLQLSSLGRDGRACRLHLGCLPDLRHGRDSELVEVNDKVGLNLGEVQEQLVRCPEQVALLLVQFFDLGQRKQGVESNSFTVGRLAWLAFGCSVRLTCEDVER